MVEDRGTEKRNLAPLELPSRSVTFQINDTFVFIVFHWRQFLSTNRFYKNTTVYFPSKKSGWELSALSYRDPFMDTCL